MGLANFISSCTGELIRRQANNKKFNRQGEFLLGDVECLFAVLDRANYPQDELDRLWKLLLLNQFHDIIPGSSITPVYEDSDRDYEDILSSGAKLRDAVVANAAGESGDNVMAINTLSKAREGGCRFAGRLDGNCFGTGLRA